MSKDKDSTADFMLELATKNGVSCATTKDGHVMIFKVTALKEILKQAGDNEIVTVFIKRPDFIVPGTTDKITN
jgi:hypothetical protein